MTKNFYYFPYPVEVAGKQYVREMTRQTGCTTVHNYPIDYGK